MNDVRWNVPGKKWCFFPAGGGWLSHIVEKVGTGQNIFFCKPGLAPFSTEVRDMDDGDTTPTCLWCAAWWMP